MKAWNSKPTLSTMAKLEFKYSYSAVSVGLFTISCLLLLLVSF